MKYTQMSFDDLSTPGRPIYCCIDFETGGLDEKTCGLSSAGIVRLDEDLKEVDRSYFLMYEPDRKYEQSALNVNKLTLDQIQKEGKRPEEFLPILHDLCDGMIMVCHNSQFDLRWANNRGFNFTDAVCTMENSMSIWPSQKAKLGMVYNRIFGHDFVGAHNALDDVLATIDVLRWQVSQDNKWGEPKPINWDRFKR